MTLERGLGKTIVAGPCAAESRGQIMTMAEVLNNREVGIMRASLWKPRTKPGGFEGAGDAGIPWLAEASKMGITVATEVLLPEHVTRVVEGLSQKGDPQKMLLWLGSRNQNHFLQREIAARMASEAPPSTMLMVKNQPWGDEAHWLGIIDHVTNAGFPAERIILCHRGFAAYGREDARGLRNPPDWEMAMRVKEISGLPMLVDPSHIGGSVANVLSVTREAMNYPFDGFIIEVHPDAREAKTDQKQQLGFPELDMLLEEIKNSARITV